MAIQDDVKIFEDKKIMDQWRKQFVNILSDVDTKIAEITDTRWGPLLPFSAHITKGIDKLEAMKLEYPTHTAEIDTWIAQVSNQIELRKTAYTENVYNPVNGI